MYMTQKVDMGQRTIEMIQIIYYQVGESTTQPVNTCRLRQR